MQITFAEIGIEETLRRLDQLQGARGNNTRRRMLRAGIRVVETHAKDSMNGPKSGRVYIINGREHQASAPGEPPAVVYGNLKNSIKVQEVTDDHATLAATGEYAVPLEYGTARMAARPFMRPAAYDHLEEIGDVMTRVADEALDGR